MSAASISTSTHGWLNPPPLASPLLPFALCANLFMACSDPQYRLWLRDPDTEAALESVGLAITLSTPIEEAEIGLHVMRNAFCQFYNEKIEVLADRYQKVAGICPHSLNNEVTFDIHLEDSFEVKKNGCEANFPFFIVPSLMDKKMAGP